MTALCFVLVRSVWLTGLYQVTEELANCSVSWKLQLATLSNPSPDIQDVEPEARSRCVYVL